MKMSRPITPDIAPPGWSWHGDNLQNDTNGVQSYPYPSHRESALLEALERIVLETLYYSPVRPMDSESHLPEHLVQAANKALAAFGMDVKPTPASASGQVVTT